MISMATEKDSIRFSSLFTPAEVICQTRETDRDKMLLDLLRRLAEQHEIGSIEEVHAAVLARETDLPTVVAPGMAMPHARLETLDEMLVAVATSREGIVYDTPRSDNRAKLIILTLVPKFAPGVYLQAISSLARICQDPATPDRVAGLPTPQDVWAFFDQGGRTSSTSSPSRSVREPAEKGKFVRR